MGRVPRRPGPLASVRGLSSGRLRIRLRNREGRADRDRDGFTGSVHVDRDGAGQVDEDDRFVDGVVAIRVLYPVALADGARKARDFILALGGGDTPRAPIGARRVLVPAFRSSGQIPSHPRLELSTIGLVTD